MARIMSASALIIMLGPSRVVVESLTACFLSHWGLGGEVHGKFLPNFQFNAVGCVGAYIGHEESCREVFCVFRGYYPCSSCHLFV